MSMLKITVSLHMFVIDKLIIINEYDIVESDGESIEKSVKLKTRKLLKEKKLSKSQKLAKSGKKLSKSENSPNFDVKKNGLSFLISRARVNFNRL